jgi:LysR family glycine cleavage system transcriptional activator
MATRRLPPLSALRAFEAAARHESFKLAAAELAVTPTAISHQIRQLEEALGVALFERRTRRVVVTAEGRMLFPVLRDGFDAFAQAVETIRTRRQRRPLTVSATTTFTARWLVPRVAAFRAEHPSLDLRLHASDDPVDLHAGAADAAVRYGAGPWPGLIAEPLMRDRFAPVCSPALGVGEPEDLRRVPLLHSEWRRTTAETPTWRLWCERAGLAGIDVEAGMVFTDDSHAVQAAVAGQGAVLTSLLLAADELARGTLVQPFGPVIEGHRYQFVCTRAMLAHEGVRALRDWLVRAMNG